MKIFYIDTSSSYLYAGIAQDNKLLAIVKKDFQKELSKYTLSEVAKLFKAVNLNPHDIDKIIVVNGPGSYTGIRIGMTFAKIYAWAFHIPITTISSLDAMALSVETSKLVVPVIDARRNYVYAGIYANNSLIFKNQYIKLSNLIKYLDSLNQDYVFVTNDLNLKLSNSKSYTPDILKIILSFKNKENINPHLVEPNYLKLTEAEENLKELANYDN